MRPEKSCPVGMTWAAPPPRLPCVLFEDLGGEFLMVVVFDDELFPELELELFPELELLPELFPELPFPPPFRRKRLRRDSRGVMNGTNMVHRKTKKRDEKGCVKRLRGGAVPFLWGFEESNAAMARIYCAVQALLRPCRRSAEGSPCRD